MMGIIVLKHVAAHNPERVLRGQKSRQAGNAPLGPAFAARLRTCPQRRTQMTSHSENELLTRVGPGTPMG
jgi:hypothetical protein